MSFIKSLPITSDMVSLWIPSGTSRAIDVIRGNHGQCYGTHPNVPVIREDSALGSLDYDNLSGTFTVGEDITGGTSSAFGVIVSDDGSTLVLKDCTGLFNNNEEITGATSEATADVNHPDAAVGADGHVKNGAFVTNTDPPADWTAVTATLTTDASGQVGNMMTVASSGANVGKAYQDATTVIGKVYKFTGYFKKGTSATGSFYIGTTGDEDAIWDSGNLTDASFAVHTHTFTATATTTRLTCKTNDTTDTETSLFDEISLYEIDRYQLINPSVGWVFGGDDYVDLAGLTDGGTSFSFSFWAYSRDNTTALKYLLDIETGRIILGWSAGTAGKIGVFDGEWREFGNSPSAYLWHCVTFSLNGATSKMKMFLNGSQYGSELDYTPLSIGGSVVMGGYHLKNSYFFDGNIALPFVANKAWSQAQVKNFYLATKGLFAPRG